MENLAQFVSVLLRRLVFVVPILFGVITLTFVVTRIVPGDPSYQLAGPFAGTDLVKSIQEKLGTDKPLWDQYISYLGDAIHLDFGNSFFTGEPVQNDLANRLPSTLLLIGLALLVATVIGISAGIFAARREARRSDQAVRFGSFFLLSIPDYWLGLLFLYVFFFRLGWAPPPTGQLGPTDIAPNHITGAALLDSALTANGSAFVSALHHALLPVITLGLVLSAPLARLTRSSMLEVQQADYIRFGRACGLPSRQLLRYTVRAALPPVVTFGGILFTVLIGGAVLVETVFSWGGAGQYAADAIKQQDYPAIQGFVLVTGVISVIVFLIVDLLYVYIDPRVKL